MDINKGKRAFIAVVVKSLESEFNTVCPELSLVAARYLGVKDSKTANRYATECKLPIPAFRLGVTQKSPYHVNIYDVAELVYERYCDAKRDHRNFISNDGA